MKWKSIEFSNIQSWENGKLEFNQDGLTVIEAKSETGKSVFIKCIRLGLYFEQYNPKTHAAIIRNFPQNKYGTFSITLEDNTLVVFRYYESSVKTAIKYPDGKLEGISRENIKKVADLLNLIICKDSVRILNILDNESPMLYDTTDMTYNNNIMSLFLDHDDLRSRKKYAEDYLKQLKSSEGNYLFLLKSNEEKLQRINFNCDISSIEKVHENLIDLNNKINFFEPIRTEISNLKRYKVYNTTNLDKCNGLLKVLDVYTSLLKELLYIKSFKQNTVISLDLSVLLLNNINFLTNLYTELNSLLSLTLNKAVINLQPIRDYKLKIESLLSLYVICNELHNCIVAQEITSKNLAHSENELQNFKRVNKACPLCGRLWEVDDCETS